MDAVTGRRSARGISRSVAVFGFAAAAAIGASSAFADDLVNTGYFGGVAIMGYDTVAYFTEGKAVKGSEKFSYEWLGTPWHFANAEHRDMFVPLCRTRHNGIYPEPETMPSPFPKARDFR